MPTSYYPQNTNTDGTCDAGAASGDHDMAKTAGTPTTHTTDTTGITSFTLDRSYQIDVSGDSPATGSRTYNLSISVNTINRTDLRFRIAAVDTTGCARTYSSYSSTYTTAAVHTFSLTLNFAATDEHLELQVECQENTTHGGRDYTLDVQSSNTWVEAPWPLAGVKPPSVL